MEKSFNEIIMAESPKLFNYLRKILRNQEDAEDILQEVFIAVYKHWDTISPEAREAYIFRTAYNKALNYIKKRNNQPDTSLIKPELLSFSDSIESTEDNQEKQNEEIRFAMNELPAKYSILIELKYFQNKSYREIAEIVDLTESAVDSRIVRAKKKLRKIILKRRNMNEKKSNRMQQGGVR